MGGDSNERRARINCRFAKETAWETCSIGLKPLVENAGLKVLPEKERTSVSPFPFPKISGRSEIPPGLFHQPIFYRVISQLCIGRELQFFQDTCAISAHRLDAERQNLGDL